MIDKEVERLVKAAQENDIAAIRSIGAKLFRYGGSDKMREASRRNVAKARAVKLSKSAEE